MPFIPWVFLLARKPRGSIRGRTELELPAVKPARLGLSVLGLVLLAFAVVISGVTAQAQTNSIGGTGNSYIVAVTVTDSSGTNAAISEAIMVTDADLGSPHDADDNEVIDGDEAIAAVIDVFDGLIAGDKAIDVTLLNFFPTPAPTVEREFEADAAVAGYWSDGAANVEVAVSLRNSDSPNVDRAVQMSVACSQNLKGLNDCGKEKDISIPAGHRPAARALTVRVPVGDVSFTFSFGEDDSQRLDFNVPERILGVDRDVWECFSDKSNVNTVREEDEGIGCAGWAEETIQKWVQTSRPKVFVEGPEGFAAEFKEVLSDLSYDFGLQFEWVDAQDGADIAAYVGLTITETTAQDVYCLSPEAFGCANPTWNPQTGEVLRSEIVVYNVWPDHGVDFGDFDDWRQVRFRSAMIHEAVHALGRMIHRTELLSVMNDEVHHRAELSPMDEALLRLHGHHLVKPGMTMADVENLIVFNDELLDPRPRDHRFAAWSLVSHAYTALREADSASFTVRSSFPGCPETFGWAEYQAGNPTGRNPYFGWVRIDNAENHIYALQPHSDQFEYWLQGPSGWSEVGSEALSGALSGWRGDLSDPHQMLESILYYADWTDAQVTVDSDGRTMLRFKLDTVRGAIDQPVESVQVVVIVDDETHSILEYTMDWDLDDVTCDKYRIEATDGRYGDEFVLPEAIRQDSDFIDDCEIEHLGFLKGYVRRTGNWARECGTDRNNEGYARSYQFALDDWSFARFELLSADDISFNLRKDDGADAEIVDLDATGYLDGGRGVPEGGRLRWTHAPLPAGEYTVELVTKNRALPGVYTLIVTAQPTPPPPYEFKSISVSGGRSCGIISDGTPLCWGSRGVEGEGSEVPSGKFASISSTGNHICALREDGTPVCWDFEEEGQHTCAPKDGAIYCSLNNQQDPGDSSKDRNFGTVAVVQVGVTAGYYDQTPPAGEKLTSISTGWVHSCGLREDGTAVCWGSNQGGKASPPAGEKFVSVEAGTSHSCGLRADGAAVCWGADREDLLAVPVGERFVSISAGENNSCGLREDGSGVCWGDRGFSLCTATAGGSYGCRRVGTRDHIPAAPPERERFESLSTGFPDCALRSDGSSVCWTRYRTGPETSPTGERFTSISSSSLHACALRTDGAAACWGEDRFGQSSPPSGFNLTEQLIGPQPPIGLTSISSGSYHTCALDLNGEVSCWGPNWWKGRFSDRLSSISSGYAHACGLRQDGTIVCRGSNDEGQSSPPDENLVSITSGFYHSCGLRDDGTVACWGKNSSGQASPPAGQTFDSISSGGSHVCALRSSGAAVCWGWDDFGQATPPGGEVLSSISSGGSHTCGLRMDGTALCWGLDREGQASPPSGHVFASISSGQYHTCGLRADGAAVCWGGGQYDYGQTSPPAEGVFVSISSGGFHTCGIRADGTAVCWGNNNYNQSLPCR